MRPSTVATVVSLLQFETVDMSVTSNSDVMALGQAVNASVRLSVRRVT